MMQSINIFLVDDHPMIASGIKNLLKGFKHITVENTYERGGDLLNGLKVKQPDIILLDAQLPDFNGKDLARELAENYPAVKILVVTSMDDLSYVIDMMRAGCKGYLLKSASRQMLLEAIEEVYKGHEYIMPSIKERLLSFMVHNDTANKKSPLTNREKEVLRLIVKGCTSSEIASQLYISQRTVENHRFSILHKLEAKNTIDLLHKATHFGLI